MHRTDTAWSRRLRRAAGLAGLWLGAACGSPEAPGGSQHDYVAAFDASSGGFELRSASPTARTRSLKLFASDVRFDAIARRLHVRVSIHSDDPEVRLGPRAVLVLDFAPRDVWPANAGCVPPDSTDLPQQCLFGYYFAYGDDHALDPGETSDPVEWILENPSGGDLTFHADFWWPHGAAP